MADSAHADEPISRALARLVERTANVRDGQVAGYIPELALADPERCGVALVSMSGQLYAAGDSDTEFTIQSVSKPFAYAIAISDLGLDGFSEFVGSEPSGEPFKRHQSGAGHRPPGESDDQRRRDRHLFPGARRRA